MQLKLVFFFKYWSADTTAENNVKGKKYTHAQPIRNGSNYSLFISYSLEKSRHESKPTAYEQEKATCCKSTTKQNIKNKNKEKNYETRTFLFVPFW